MNYIIKKNYEARIVTSQGADFFKNLFFEIDGQIVDILKNGEDSCAFHTTTVLYTCTLIRSIHATVSGALQDMKQSGWYEIAEPKQWCVVVWAPTPSKDGTMHRHIGFAMENNQAISNSSEYGVPKMHDINVRPIECFLWNKLID
ncbi:MAG: hypothetical protein RIQ54_365 [Candidatus Parcubacteria bacterium]|jgi:hypothetical protein